MKKGIKILVLTILLLTPAAIYIFLQAFGHNEFDLPFYSEEGKLEESSSNSVFNPKIFSFEELRDSNGIKVDQDSFAGDIIVLDFAFAQTDHKKRDYQIKRISNIFRNEGSVRIVRVFIDSDHSGIKQLITAANQETNVSLLYTDLSELNKMIHFEMSSNESTEEGTGYDKILLLDKQHRIRGDYSADDFEEIDRLILEVKILLKQERHA